jgi:hypothetical protein
MQQGLYAGTICAWGLDMRNHPKIAKVKREGLMVYKGIAIKGRALKMDTRKPAFDSWLRMQFNRNDPVGDLASDVHADRRFRRKRFGYASLMDHLIASKACIDAITALRDAHKEFKQAMKGPKP